MNNPYDVYNDNRAYHGYERCRRDVIEKIDELMKISNGRVVYALNELKKGIE